MPNLFYRCLDCATDSPPVPTSPNNHVNVGVQWLAQHQGHMMAHLDPDKKWIPSIRTEFVAESSDRRTKIHLIPSLDGTMAEIIIDTYTDAAGRMLSRSTHLADAHLLAELARALREAVSESMSRNATVHAAVINELTNKQEGIR